MKKWILRISIAIVIIVALCLLLLPVVIKQAAESVFPDHVKEATLAIEDLSIGYFSGKVALSNVVISHQEKPAFTLKSLVVDVAMLELIKNQYAVVEEIVLDGIEVDVTQTDTGYMVAGYALDKPEQDTEASDTAVQESEQIKPEQPTEIAEDTSAANETETETAGEEEPAIKGFGVSSIRISDVFANVDVEGVSTRLGITQFELNDFYSWLPEADTPISIGVLIERADIQYQDAVVSLKQPLSTKVSVKASQLLENPKASFDVFIQDIDVAMESIDTELLSLSSVNVKGGQWADNNLVVEGVSIEKFATLTQGDNQAVATFESLAIETINLNNLNALDVAQVTLSGLKTHAVLTKERSLPVVDDVMNAFVANEESEAVAPVEPEAVEEAADTTPAEPNEPFTVTLGQFLLTGDNALYVKDNGVEGGFEGNIAIPHFELNTVNTGDTSQKSAFKGQISLSEYNEINIDGNLTLLDPALSGELVTVIKSLEMVPLSPYMLEATGYYIRTGAYNSELKIAFDKGEMDGELDIHMQALKLEPGAEGKIAKMKEKISMPLDTALNLIRDGKGNIDLNVPIDGNVNSPDFSVNSILNKIMFKAIKAATVYYLKQSMQPYGALISIGSYLGKKATAVRLDPVKFAKGEVLLNEEHTAYLDKIAGLMKSKEGINVKLCGVGVPNELIVEAQPPQPPLENAVLLARMEQRAAAVKKYMVETGQVEANRLLACQAIVEAESEDVLSYIHLEI